ncbi:MAG: hypothetical protein OEZ36_03605 [Spirochaetota bacterium]|nr:hypothetical protein [Spirochaetota bacterium]
MSSSEKTIINEKLREIVMSFGLKVKLTVSNAQDFIEENYKKIREIDNRIQKRVNGLNLNY